MDIHVTSNFKGESRDIKPSALRNSDCLELLKKEQPSPSQHHPSYNPSVPPTKEVNMADKLRTLQNLEALQARYVGTGHADTTKYEWTSNIIRDSYASYIGHPPLLEYMAIGMGENKEKVRAMMIEKMVRGAGNPPEVRIVSST
ncbi:hypothetical protein FQN53_000954 [Emmonsiellopsis sp. PD_33]|nr:hypothetical protein FQN53_000954 [Emmonsiellopsis sp. PD_33]